MRYEHDNARERAKRYALAFVKQGRLESGDAQLAMDLAELGKAMTAKPSLVDYFASPLIQPQVWIEEFARLKAGLHVLTLRLLGVLAQSRALHLLPLIAQEVSRLYDGQKGAKRVTFRTAVPLGPEDQETLQTLLGARLGAPVILDVRVDAKLLFGFVVETEGRRLDISAASRLQRLFIKMKG